MVAQQACASSLDTLATSEQLRANLRLAVPGEEDGAPTLYPCRNRMAGGLVQSRSILRESGPNAGSPLAGCPTCTGAPSFRHHSEQEIFFPSSQGPIPDYRGPYIVSELGEVPALRLSLPQ